jgi:hypothetical protein
LDQLDPSVAELSGQATSSSGALPDQRLRRVAARQLANMRGYRWQRIKEKEQERDVYS